LAERRAVKLAEVAREPLLIYSRKDYPDAFEALTSMFAGLKSKPRVAEEHDSVSSLIAAVQAGNGVAIVVQSVGCTAGPRLKLIPFSPAPPPLVVGGSWLKSGLTSAAQRFLKCARESVQHEQNGHA
jgi:DNA-binding transcriptional LysR family regulator